MGCAECAAKTVLIIVNTIFLLLGLILLSLGIILTTNSTLVNDLLEPLLQSSSIDLSSASSSSSASEAVVNLLGLAGYISIGLGGFMILAGALGCAGSCCKIRTLLIVYAVIVLLLFLVKLIFLILLVTATLDNTIEAFLEDEIIYNYGGTDDTSVESIILNTLMVTYQCCGIWDRDDIFDKAVNWDGQYQYTAANGQTRTVQLDAPVVCCKSTGSFPDISLTYDSCPLVMDGTTSNINTGCWDEITSELKSLYLIIIGVYAGVLAIEGICAAFAIYLIIRTVRDEKDGKINPMLD